LEKSRTQSKTGYKCERERERIWVNYVEWLSGVYSVNGRAEGGRLLIHAVTAKNATQDSPNHGQPCWNSSTWEDVSYELTLSKKWRGSERQSQSINAVQ
jgi:hypothetical protein